ncbi:MAG TPA: hypothetical protein DEO33_05660, partial [Rikenellaceae bacterium]|nr:hypothetical protein [Rikenellaceae bacterium]
MSLTTFIFRQLSKIRLSQLDKTRINPWKSQTECFKNLIASGRDTLFGKEHDFEKINNVEEFQKKVPLRDYDSLEPYIDRIRRGEDYVLWNTKVKWFAKSSGTSSSKSKFIPVTNESLNNCHYNGMKTLLASYVNSNPDSRLFDGKSLTLGGSTSIDEIGDGNTLYGDLSAILIKNSPPWTELKRIPQRSTALMADFEKKIELMSPIIATEDVTNFSGVPSWNLVLMN